MGHSCADVGEAEESPSIVKVDAPGRRNGSTLYSQAQSGGVWSADSDLCCIEEASYSDGRTGQRSIHQTA